MQFNLDHALDQFQNFVNEKTNLQFANDEGFDANDYKVKVRPIKR